jgi:hypothetical protein
MLKHLDVKGSLKTAMVQDLGTREERRIDVVISLEIRLFGESLGKEMTCKSRDQCFADLWIWVAVSRSSLRSRPLRL